MLNTLDRAIGYVAPSWAMQRARARMAIQIANSSVQRFRYDGAITGRRAEGWLASSSDANAELIGSLVWLRDRSRDLVRNNPYAGKAIEELVGNTVGTGIIPQANTGNTALDRVIDAEWPYFADTCDPNRQCDFYGQQSLTVRTMAESGDAITRFRQVSANKQRIPLQTQILESDFLDQNRQTEANESKDGYIIQGVEFDNNDQRIAYWLFNRHPGGPWISNFKGGLVSDRVQSSEVLHAYRLLRPGLVRGVPWLAPVMLALRDLEDYKDAERIRKKIEACLAAFVTLPEKNGQTLGLTDPNATGADRVERFAPGMVAYIPGGSKVEMNSPQAAGGYGEYIKTELHAISSGIGVPYEMLGSDMSDTTFSSWRGGMLGFRNTIEGFRWLTLIPLHSQPIRKRFIDNLVLLGKIPEKLQSDKKLNIYGTVWTSPKWESVDPIKDAEAEEKRIRIGTQLWDDAVAANGGDRRTQLDRMEQNNKEFDARGLILDCDPRRVNKNLVGNPDEPVAPKPKVAKQSANLRAWDVPSRYFAT